MEFNAAETKKNNMRNKLRDSRMRPLMVCIATAFGTSENEVKTNLMQSTTDTHRVSASIAW